MSAAGDALRAVLPLGVAIAVSPVPVLAVVLMLVSDGGRGNAYALLAGWAATLAVLAGAVALLGVGSGSAGGGRGVAAAQLVLAAALAVVLAGQWRARPRRGAPHAVPPWMASVTGGLGPARAAGLGVGLVALNVKDGSLAVAAGARLGHAVPGPAAGVACLALFVLVASATVIAPVAVDVALGERAEPVLRRWHRWLQRHGAAAAMTTLAAVVVVLAVQGASGL
ncbi:GAP family protein [Baekduia soli]|uniref:GAP family protein n=1 Tax=Baekduia soli TaxID=496014 RepID=UPI0016528EB0|nr:GAP family protein [Baekduia soli]